MKLIFVCTSNVCRSPAAAALALKWLEDHGRDWEVISRSISTDFEPENSPASKNSIEVLKNDFHLDITSHFSKLLTQDDINEADFIIGITRSHQRVIQHEFSAGNLFFILILIIKTYNILDSKCIRMPRDIPDPWHANYETYRECIHLMANSMNELFEIIDNLLLKNIDNNNVNESKK